MVMRSRYDERFNESERYIFTVAPGDFYREYIGANACDPWGRCDDIKQDGSNNKLELKALTSNASNCSSSTCDYNETIKIKLSDDFLKDSVENAFNILLISKKKSHKIKISKAYLMGYLQIAQ